MVLLPVDSLRALRTFFLRTLSILASFVVMMMIVCFQDEHVFTQIFPDRRAFTVRIYLPGCIVAPPIRFIHYTTVHARPDTYVIFEADRDRLAEGLKNAHCSSSRLALFAT